MRVNLNRQLVGLEDITFGVGTEEQTRGGQTVEITKINAANLPFDEINTLQEVLDATYPLIIPVGEKLVEIQTVYDNIDSVVIVATELTSTDNIETVVTDLLLGVNSEIRKVNAIATEINQIVSDIIPNLAEILAADDNAELARRYANEDEDVEVEDGMFSAKHYAIKALEIVTDGVIDDETPSALKTYSSTKIEVELLERDNRLDTAESDLDTKSDKVFTNTDTAGAGILVGNNVVEWTKGFTAFAGAILIELTGLYNEASMVGRMKIVINQAVGDDRVIYIDGRWLSTTHIWDEANVVEVSTALSKLNVRFARDVANSKVYLVIGETSSTWNALRIMIDEVLTNYDLSLNLGFVITSTTDISGLTVDYTKTDVQYSNTNDYLGSLITEELI